MQVFSYICVTLLCNCICAESNSLYNDRFSDRSKSRYTADDETMAVIEDPPPPVPYAAAPAPYYYSRMGPYYYGDYYHPRQRFMRYMDERPVKRSDYYFEPQRRQCRSPIRRRSASYTKGPYKLVPLVEEAYYASDSNSPSHSERIARNMYSSGVQDDAEHDDTASDDSSSNAKFADDKYPTVLANFKIGSKLDKKSIVEPHGFMKREYRQKESGSNVKEKGGDVSSFDEIEADGKVAEELRDILDYMGLIDEDNNLNSKAAAEARDSSKKESFEDENLEEGSNKISLTKEDRTSGKERSKRQGSKSSTESYESATIAHLAGSDQDNLQSKSANTNNEPTKRETLRMKRQENNDTLSHKSSLTSSDDVPLIAEGTNANDYEKRVERQIQSRINALKEEVKREIAALKAQEAAQAVHNLNEDTQRKKRQAISTLIEEENSELDPALHPEGSLKPHIRKRRNLEFTDTLTTESSSDESEKNNSASSMNQDDNSTSSYTTNNYIQNFTIKYTESYLLDLDTVPEFIDKSSIEATTETINISSGQTRNSNTDEHIINEENTTSMRDISSKTLSRRKRDTRNSDEVNANIPVRFAPNRLESQSAAYVPGRSYMADEEEGEMDYDGFYDIVRNVERQNSYVGKRSAPYKHKVRRSSSGLEFFNRNPTNRRIRRENCDSASFHGGGPTENQFSSLRSRNMASFQPRVRRRRAYSKRDVRNFQQPQTLNDMSDTDIFGALPQSYDGELNRFKRVRRSKKNG